MKQPDPKLQALLHAAIKHFIPNNLGPINITGEEAIKTLNEIRLHLNGLKHFNDLGPIHPNTAYVELKKILTTIEAATSLEVEK